MVSKQLWINDNELGLENPKLYSPASMPMDYSYGLLVNNRGLSQLDNWFSHYIKANDLDYEEFITGPVLQFLTTITQEDFLDSDDMEESLISLREILEDLFPEQSLPHVKGYALEDVSFPDIIADGLARIQSIELLISGEYEGTHTQEIYNSHNFDENHWSIHGWHLMEISVDCLLNELFIILHAGEDPVVNV